jgi:hypothetical protein
LVEFRWLRRNTHLGFDENPLVPPHVTAGFRPDIGLNYFLGDFTREWKVEDAPSIQPFIRGTLGAARLGAPASSATRFVFGAATGLKIFPKPHWGFRIEVEYLPIVLHTEIQRIVCTQGCIVALTGGITNQFSVSFGPAFRF